MEKVAIDNPRYPHHVKITRESRNGDYSPFSETPESVEDIIYDECGRSFTDTTTEGDNKVDENKRKASIPVRYDEWDVGKQPLDGDIIEVTIGNNTETGIVKDSEPDNNRTLVYWNFRRV